MSLDYLFVERFTQACKIIDNDHAYIHQGYAFQTDDLVDINGTRKYQFTTPASTEDDFKYIHFRPANISIAANALTFKLEEGSTSVTGGSTGAPVNRNRNSSNASTVTYKAGVTASAGTELQSFKIHAGGGPGTGAAQGEPLEWVLKPGTNYIVSLTTTASISVSSNFFWYEEDGGA